MLSLLIGPVVPSYALFFDWFCGQVIGSVADIPAGDCLTGADSSETEYKSH